MSARLTVSGVCKRYGPTTILDHVALAVARWRGGGTDG